MRVGIAAIVAVVATIVLAPGFAEEAHYPFNPEIGTKWHFDETRTIETNSKGKQPRTTARVLAELSVIARNDSGFVFEWRTLEIASGGERVGTERPDLLMGVAIRFTADHEGLPIIVHDVDDLIDRAMEAITSARSKSSDAGVLAKVRRFLENTDPALLASMLLREVAAFGNCHNFRLEPGVVVKDDYAKPMPGDAPPIRTEVFVEMKPRVRKGEPVEIKILEFADPDSAADSVGSLLGSMDSDADKDKISRAVDGMAMESRTICRIDPVSGTAVSIRQEMRVRADSVFKNDIREITITQIK